MAMMKVVALVATLVVTLGSVVNGMDWWENGNFYQIYPRSFRDSDGDGIGDLNGVTEKLQYLKDIGFTAVWLSPIFKSPMADFGYDISDFYDIHGEYGTMRDFENMVAKANEVGIKIVLDFVPNHSSDECEWFEKSVQKDAKYKDYYIWHDGVVNGAGVRQPPNNWVSVFRFGAWTWHEVRQQYYFHQFAVKQPDLNYRHPELVQEMKNVLEFWLRKGVAGFRIDAIPFLFEVKPDADGNQPDEPVIENINDCPDPDDHCHLQHIHTTDQPETFDMVYQWRALTDAFKKANGGDTRILMTEAYSSLENMLKYYGDGTRNGSQVPFNFEFLSNVHNDTNAKQMVQVINRWLDAMPTGSRANWVLGNHDNRRIASRFGVQRTDLFNILLQTLPGIAITYNGEELGMTDVFVSWEDTVDIQACNTSPERYEAVSRDPARTPYQWDASNKAGFTSGPTTWLPVSDDYRKTNALQQLRAPRSHLQIFKKLVRLRQESAFERGTFNIRAEGDDVLVYERISEKNAYVVILNLGAKATKVPLKAETFGSSAEVIVSSINSRYIDGQIVSTDSFECEPYVGVVLVGLKKD